MTAFIVGISCTILGAIFQYLLPKVDEAIKTRRRSDLQGEWYSISHGGEETRIEDRIEISLRRGKLYLVNKDKTANYSYEAYCEIKDRHILLGEWKSLLPGSSVSGYLILLISSHGDYMYGIYSGTDKQGKPMLLGWVLGRSKEAVSKAEKSLEANLERPLRLKP